MRRFVAAFVLALTVLMYVPAVTAIHPSTVPTQSQGNPRARVWVNTESGVYHCAGSQWYGKTKHGKYMWQKNALAAGYRPANDTVCE
jgi:hypothetical protein